MATAKKNDWNTKEGRLAIFRAVMQHLHQHPEERAKCVEDDAYARQVVTNYGHTDVPADAKVVFLPEGDNLRGGSGPQKLGGGIQYEPGASLIITLPSASVDPNGKQVLAYSCTYNQW